MYVEMVRNTVEQIKMRNQEKRKGRMWTEDAPDAPPAARIPHCHSSHPSLHSHRTQSAATTGPVRQPAGPHGFEPGSTTSANAHGSGASAAGVSAAAIHGPGADAAAAASRSASDEPHADATAAATTTTISNDARVPGSNVSVADDESQLTEHDNGSAGNDPAANAGSACHEPDARCSSRTQRWPNGLSVEPAANAASSRSKWCRFAGYAGSFLDSGSWTRDTDVRLFPTTSVHNGSVPCRSSLLQQRDTQHSRLVSRHYYSNLMSAYLRSHVQYVTCIPVRRSIASE